jgi:hypothetical protein
MYAAGISFVFVEQNETYPIPNKTEVGIGKNALDRIAAASGVRWISSLCGRVDREGNPHAVEFQAVGAVLQLDGTERTISAIKRVDLRTEGDDVTKWGAEAQEIAYAAKKKGREPMPQILQARQHILSLAESKAKNRAIRSLGIRTAYEPTELSKGFAILKLQFTGHSEDPEVAREVQLMVARRALGSSEILYGRPSQMLQPGRVVPRIEDPKPGAVAEEDHEPIDVPSDPVKPAASGAAPATSPKPEHDPEMPVGKKDPATGKFPRKRASEMSVDQLTSLIEYHEGKKPTWDSKWREKNQFDLDALYEWRTFKSADPNQLDLPPMDEYGEGAEPGEDNVPF